MIGEAVTLRAAAITFGALTVEIDETPTVSQPTAVAGKGATKVVAALRHQGRRGTTSPIRVLSPRPPPSATSPPRSPRSAPSRATSSSILRALKAAGALRADLETL